MWQWDRLWTALLQSCGICSHLSDLSTCQRTYSATLEQQHTDGFHSCSAPAMKPPPVSPGAPDQTTPLQSQPVQPSQQLEMKALRNTVQRLLSPRRGSPHEESNSPRWRHEPVPPRLEDRRDDRRDEVTITEDGARMPDRPRAPPTRLRAPTPSSKNTEYPEDDEDYSMEPSSSSNSSGRSRRSGEPNSSSSCASRSGSSQRDSRSGMSMFTVERRRARVSEAAMDTAQELSRKLSEADSESSAEGAIRLVGEFAFGTNEPAGMLERQDALDETGALQKLVDIVGKYIAHIGVVALVLSIFGGLRIDEGIGLRVGMMGMVETMVAALHMYNGDARVVREGLRALCGLTRLDDVRTRILARCGAIEGVIDCLQRHEVDEAVQTEGARFVAYASMHSETNKTELAKGGGLGRVLSAARDFRESRALCTNVCTALRNVTVGRPDIVEVVLGLDAVDGLLEILSGHGGAYMTATHVLAGLFHMTGRDAGIQEVLRHEGWEVILLESGRRHTSRACVQALCLAIMGRVAVGGGPLAARRLVRCGAVKMALVGMHRFVNRRALLYFGARLVRVLLEQGGGMEDVRAFGGVDKLLDLLYCTVVTGGSGEERYSGYADVFSES